ncbi:MAG: Hsp20/alpha crystallin family protein [Lachnospiraceae bacterium]|nr:Hsp20/alpha crystallin family protein [Candidatus Fimimorpha excrementavium]
MLRPSIFSNDFMDDWFDDMFTFPEESRRQTKNTAVVMRTDVKDLGDKYQLDIELPGYKKEDIHAELHEGYLTVSAKKSENTEEKQENGKYIRRERYTGECRRSFFVGKTITEEDIHAAFENGVLKLTVVKEESKPKVEEKKYITIG